MIDIEREELVSLVRATRYVPRRRGKKVHATTLWAWIVRGHRGVVLEGLRTPVGWCTTAGAVQRFLAELARRERERIRLSDERLGRARRL